MSSRRVALKGLLLFVMAAPLLLAPERAAASDWCSGGVCQEWVARYDRTGTSSDSAGCIGVDSLGNVYVAGNSLTEGIPADPRDFVMVKYNASGSQQWVWTNSGGSPTMPGGPSGLVVDHSDNVIMTGSTYNSIQDYRWVTTKLSGSGHASWTRYYDGPWSSGIDVAAGVAIDSANNVYVVGSTDFGVGTSYMTVKYSSDGDEQWSVAYPSEPNTYIWAYAVAVDGSDDVYVTGTAGTVKYDSDGNQEWVVGPGGRAITVDDAGNSYFTGWSGTFKYDNDGNQEWAAGANGTDIALDGLGNVYVTGASGTVKYDTEGSQLWSAGESAKGIALGGPANIYVAGESGGDYVTVKYDGSGNEQWLATYDGPGGEDDGATALAADTLGNVYVTGYSTGVGTGNDFATVKYYSDPLPTPTATATPDPRAVGGIAEASDGPVTSSAAEEASLSSRHVGLAMAAALVCVALAGGWYARRRYGRQRR